MTSSMVAAFDVDEDFMNLIKDKTKSLSSNIAQSDVKAAKDDADEIIDMFNDVEAFYVKKGNAQDAVDWSKEAKNLTASITKYVEAKDYDAAAQASVTLSKSCKSCHNVYKKDKK